ncbi:hypothetical protein TNCV_261091 [Trichonephila clavipes]|nr:hypothetical protein TNCV_261091 [Trichonephila clavipes]
MESLIASNLSRPAGVANFRIKTGHDYLTEHLHRFGLVDSHTWPLCNANDTDQFTQTKKDGSTNITRAGLPELFVRTRKTFFEWS